MSADYFVVCLRVILGARSMSCIIIRNKLVNVNVHRYTPHNMCSILNCNILYNACFKKRALGLPNVYAGMDR